MNTNKDIKDEELQQEESTMLRNLVVSKVRWMMLKIS